MRLPSPLQADRVVSDLADEPPKIPLPPPTRIPTEVLEVDLRTPDSHVPRDPRLIRLTGVHPFNVEAPLTALFDEGFLTSPELFYVRNHGPVPEVTDDDISNWTFTVEGLVETSMTISLRELMTEYEQVTCPITLVCAGNRRKEQNVVRKSKGFNWGAAGVSTALFTGVIMADVIRRAKPLRKARYVCMEGADRLPNGSYGTSVKLNWAMDPNRGFMLAYKMNGEPLRPDHGKPLRVVVPGQIGGRSVKWLKRLILTDAPSDNWYHIYDNRVLPTMITPGDSANDPDWWKDERYAIYDLSPNSAICYPAHDERLSLNDSSNTYRAQGYAYSGGGRLITRVEISLDQGRTWRLTTINYPEDLYRNAERVLYGGRVDMSWRESSFCWCFWSIDLAITDLAKAQDILVRAMDESMNIQPRDMYWSVLGMMNNPWFRVAITLEGNETLQFEHPTQPALIPGGWMERVKNAGGDLTNGFWGENAKDGQFVVPVGETQPQTSMIQPGLKNLITIDELRRHDGKETPWFVVNGEVYDGTNFLREHPGGAQSIISAAGTDSSEEFLAIHSDNARATLSKYHIGTLDENAGGAVNHSAFATAEKDFLTETFLGSKAWKKVLLHEKRSVSPDTSVFTFKLDHPQQQLGLGVGQHVFVKLVDPVTRDALIRSYTPISDPVEDHGFVNIMVKIYRSDGPSFAGGRMSQALAALPAGHFLEIKGPIGKFEYRGHGCCVVSGKARTFTSLIMICAGSGITPIYQVLRAVMQDRTDKTRCVLFNCNRQIEDILLKKELDALAVEHPDRFRIVYTLTRAPQEWTGHRGRITANLVRKSCLRTDRSMILICGPPGMDVALSRSLVEDRWDDSQIMIF
jgi:nitrate reductase (NAD(P)H)